MSKKGKTVRLNTCYKEVRTERHTADKQVIHSARTPRFYITVIVVLLLLAVQFSVICYIFSL